jgi:hypothetical protein
MAARNSGMVGFWAAIGAAAGAAIGAFVTHNLFMGIGIGVVAGIGIGMFAAGRSPK